MEQNNPFDELIGIDLEAAKNYLDEQKRKSERIDHLIHKVFEQTPEGKELLEIWRESLIMTPTVTEGASLETHGINEGMKRFIRNIITTIRRVENE